MAPDKIYVKEFGEGISQMWSSVKATETTANAQHEYIRKDALLEWAEEKKEKVNADDGDFSFGYMSAMIGLIDKIESM